MKKIWYVITILLISTLLINVISADTSYKPVPATQEYLGNSDNYWNIQSGTGEVRATVLYDGSNYTMGFVSQTQNIVVYCHTSGGRSFTITLDTSYNGYYIKYFNQNSGTGQLRFINNWITQEYPINNVSTYSNDQLLYYTYGDGSETQEYGELIINYAQDIRTTGNGADNLDLITWNAYRDTTGNDLQGLKIEIQAIAGYFEGSSYADLKTSLFSDWQASTHPAVTMYKGDIELSHQEYTWQEVANNFQSLNTLGTWFWNIFANDGTWYQYGWRYRARLLDENEEPLTEWQMLYTGNSYSPSATETLTDDEPLTPDDVETINDINEQNNTTNNWYINNTVINNNEYNQTWQQNIIENIYNILQGTPDPVEQQHATDVQNTIDNAIDQEDNYINDLENQLQDLQLPDISENNGLMKALKWVREVHQETIEETQLGTVVLITMIIGLITYLIGRRNG